MKSKMAKGTEVVISWTHEAGKLPEPEIAAVFEDFGMPNISVMRANGQLHTTPRARISLVKRGA
jgi:hypothetical protein